MKKNRKKVVDQGLEIEAEKLGIVSWSNFRSGNLILRSRPCYKFFNESIFFKVS